MWLSSTKVLIYLLHHLLGLSCVLSELEENLLHYLLLLFIPQKEEN